MERPTKTINNPYVSFKETFKLEEVIIEFESKYDYELSPDEISDFDFYLPYDDMRIHICLDKIIENTQYDEQAQLYEKWVIANKKYEKKTNLKKIKELEEEIELLKQ